jgi:hypothetical protein
VKWRGEGEAGIGTVAAGLATAAAALVITGGAAEVMPEATTERAVCLVRSVPLVEGGGGCEAAPQVLRTQGRPRVGRQESIFNLCVTGAGWARNRNMDMATVEALIRSFRERQTEDGLSGRDIESALRRGYYGQLRSPLRRPEQICAPTS